MAILEEIEPKTKSESPDPYAHLEPWPGFCRNGGPLLRHQLIGPACEVSILFDLNDSQDGNRKIGFTPTWMPASQLKKVFVRKRQWGHCF